MTLFSAREGRDRPDEIERPHPVRNSGLLPSLSDPPLTLNLSIDGIVGSFAALSRRFRSGCVNCQMTLSGLSSG
jgi:hypothetical protein